MRVVLLYQLSRDPRDREDAAQRAYKAALEEDDLAADVRNVISKQQIALRKSHDTIKRMRDAQPA